MSLRLLVVMNPSAHDFEARHRWPRLRPLLEHGASVTLLETDPDDAKTFEKIRRELENGHDRVLSIGGDGTVHLIVNALAGRGPEALPELAVIPFGTANNVAKSLHLPLHDLDAMARIAVGARVGGLDLGKLRWRAGNGPRHERFWINCVSVGMDADVVAARGRYRDLGGYLAYAAALAERSLEQRSIDATVEVDGQTRAERFFNVIVNNVPIYVGALEMPGAKLDDGLLDVYLFDRLEYGSKLLSFGIKHADFLKLGVSELLEQITENQRVLRGRRVVLRLERPCAVQVDGERLDAADEVECTIFARLGIAIP